MLGGNHRRLEQLDRALLAFQDGARIEAADRLEVLSSYNLVNAIVLPIEMKDSTATQQRSALRKAVEAIARQVHGARRNDRWAWADLGQCQLLLGEAGGNPFERCNRWMLDTASRQRGGVCGAAAIGRKPPASPSRRVSPASSQPTLSGLWK